MKDRRLDSLLQAKTLTMK